MNMLEALEIQGFNKVLKECYWNLRKSNGF